jgi:hypothetical protein
MATLEMVQLRSMMPHTGRVTLRYALPTVRIDVPADHTAVPPRIATTPQVEETPQEGAELETTARKGGEAR